MRTTVMDYLQGTLELLILRTLDAYGPLHGYGIARRIERTTNDVLQVQEGSLYPALHRMTRSGWLTARWGTSETNRRAKVYTLTNLGTSRLAEATQGWRRFVSAVGEVLGSVS